MKLEIDLPAPLHTAPPWLVHMQELTNVPDKLTEADVFTQDRPAKIEAEIDGLHVVLDLKIDMISNPLASKHTWIGTSRVALELSSSGHSPADLSTNVFTTTNALFTGTAIRVVNRLINYCRYKLGYPFLRPVGWSNVHSIAWFDGSGTEIPLNKGNSLIFDHFPGRPGTSRSLDSKFLTVGCLPAITASIGTDAAPTIQEDLLAQARDAVYEEHTLKAVLLLAITCEVAIKTKFFREESLASIAFDFLEENRRVEITNLELVGKVAKRAFGQSFAEFSPSSNTDIDYLFRCRNKVAHRARAEYKDDRGTPHTATSDSLYSWWQSVSCLLNWLDSQESSVNQTPRSAKGDA